jgi:hypothetical protein
MLAQNGEIVLSIFMWETGGSYKAEEWQKVV